MKLLLVSSSSGSRGGGELYLINLGAALAARGHEITFWLARHPRMDELAQLAAPIGAVIREDYRNTYDYPFRSLNTAWNPSVSRQIAQTWGGYDLIHLNKQNLEDGLDLLRAARYSGVPALCMIHITQTARFLNARNAALRDAVSRWELRKHPGLFVTVPEVRVAELKRFVGHDRVELVMTGVPITETAAPLRRAPMHVIGVGRMTAQKRPMKFLAIASKLRTRIPEVRFTWVGGGELDEQWDEQVRALGLEACVRRTGWQRDVQPYLLEADLFIHTAKFEGLPLALVEAMGAGLPCVVCEDLMKELGALQQYVLSADPAGTWMERIQDATAMRSLGAEARAFAMEHCSTDRMAQNYEALYERTIARHSASKIPKIPVPRVRA